MNRPTAWLAVLALIVPFCSPAAASTIEPMDLEVVARTAPIVLAGWITAVQTTQRTPIAESILTVQVGAVLRGTVPGQQVRVRLRQSLVHFDLPQKVGQVGVFFLTPVEKGLYQPAYPGSIALFAEDVVAPPRR